MKTKGIGFFQTIASFYPFFAISFIAFQVLSIALPINMLITAMAFLMSLVLYIIAKDFISEKMESIAFASIKLSLSLFVFGLMALAPLKKVPVPVLSIFCFGITIGIFGFLRNDSTKEKLKTFREFSISGLNHKGKESTQKVGDVFLCTNEESGDKVVIPYKDRFLHMLVLGPTGSGKTSQVLIPMINQDVMTPGHGVTVIEPKGDLAEKVYAMAEHYGREAVYFNPTHANCPYFNPLFGDEDEVLENMATTFKMLNPDSPQFFQDMNETLIKNAIKVLKRLYGNKATMLDLSTLVSNSEGKGKIMVNNFLRMKAATPDIGRENAEISHWFLNEYFNERAKTYEHTSGLRSQIYKITSNVHLRRVLNPPNGENDVDFVKVIEEGKILAISTAQGELRDLGKFLGYFIILNFQSAVFKRPGNEDTRRPHFLYIDEFQTYSNPGFADMLTQGRSYRVASHLATQNRALMAMGGGRDGKNFVELVSTNARNIVLFPGCNAIDTEYYSKEFGEIEVVKERKGISKKKFSLLFMGSPMGHPTESLAQELTKEARYSASDLIYKEFGKITYRIINNNSVMSPGNGTIEYIPRELNEELNRLVEEYKKKQEFPKEHTSTPLDVSNDSTSTIPDKPVVATVKDVVPLKVVPEKVENVEQNMIKTEVGSGISMTKPIKPAKHETKIIDDEDDDADDFF